ncbi:sensor histidine kinase [Gordonia sp. NPDC003424]
MSFARWRTTPLDAGLAVAFAVAGLVQIAIAPISTPGVLGVVYVLGSALPLAYRRTHPIPAAAVTSLFWLIPLEGFPVFGFVAVVLLFYAVGLYGHPTAAVVTVTAVAASAAVIGTLLGPEQPVAAIGAVLAVVAPVVAGRLVGYQQQQTRRLDTLTRELRAERERAERSAVEAERARIARELHDVVGHEVTLIAIQAEAAAAALTLSPDKAAAPVEAIRTTAHRTLDEMRAVLDVLSPADEAPVIDGDHIGDLASRARAAGVPNTLSVNGTPATQPSVTLAVARIVRECLTNAGRHAAGEHVDIEVDWHPDEVTVCAVNRRRSDDDRMDSVRPGRGIAGVRHRAELLGGTCDVDDADGRFAVRVVIPVGEPAR